jgi:translin
MKNLNNDVERIAGHLTEKQDTFDRAMQLSREIIRAAGQSITFLHNGETKKAKDALKSMREKVKSLKAIDSRFRYNTQQAYQEYVEAEIFYSIKAGEGLPRLSELEVEPEEYLLGIMDVVGELKREILESLRAGNIKAAESYLDIMKSIYDDTRSVRFAEAVLPGFRKKQDVARIQIENAGSDILSFRNRSG